MTRTEERFAQANAAWDRQEMNRHANRHGTPSDRSDSLATAIRFGCSYYRGSENGCPIFSASLRGGRTIMLRWDQHEARWVPSLISMPLQQAQPDHQLRA